MMAFRGERSVFRSVPVFFLLVLLFAALGEGCASQTASKDPSKGFQTVDATVIGKDFEGPGAGGTSPGGEGTYYLVFEATEGEAHATYRFPVTRTQYQRYGEGTHVQLFLANHQLRDIRPVH
jgi:hypothetical protein